MTVKQLIEELRKFPDDMPVAIFGDISWETKDKNLVEVQRRTWVHSNHPYDKPDFDYVDLR